MKQKRANIASALRTLAPDARQDLRRRLNLVADPQCRKQLHLLKEFARFVRFQLKQLPQLRPGTGTMDKDLMRANRSHTSCPISVPSEIVLSGLVSEAAAGPRAPSLSPVNFTPAPCFPWNTIVSSSAGRPATGSGADGK